MSFGTQTLNRPSKRGKSKSSAELWICSCLVVARTR